MSQLADDTTNDVGPGEREQWSAALHASAGAQRTSVLLEISRLSQDAVDAGIASAIETTNAPPACQAGCSYCCYEKVAARPNEVFVVAEHIRTTWSARARRALRQRLRNAVVHADVAPREYFELQIACPLLDEAGRCSGYSVRPTNCRRCHSYTPEDCKTACPDVVLNLYILDAVRTREDLMGSVMGDHVLQNDEVDFLKALLMALELPGLLERWAQGETVFEPWRHTLTPGGTD